MGDATGLGDSGVYDRDGESEVGGRVVQIKDRCKNGNNAFFFLAEVHRLEQALGMSAAVTKIRSC